MRRKFWAQIELEVLVDVEAENVDELEAQAEAAINREVIAPMPATVVGAWVSYVEEAK